MATKPKPKPKIVNSRGETLWQVQNRLKQQAEAKKKAAAASAKAVSDQQARDYFAKNGHLPTIGANTTRELFNTAPDPTDLDRLGRAVASGKMTLAEFNRQIQRGAAVNNPDDLRVGLDVDAELRPQLNAIERRRAAAKQNLDWQTKQDAESSDRERRDVEGIYAALLGRLGQAPGQINQQYDSTTGKIQQNYQALQDAMNAAYAKANEATQAQVQGLGGGTTQGQTGAAADHAAYASIAGIQNQGLQGILNVARTGEHNVAQGQIAATGNEGAREQAEILRALNERAAQLRYEYGLEDTELAGQYGDLSESRYARLYEGKQSLEEARAKQIQDAQDREREYAMQQAALGIKQYGAETDRLSVQQRGEIARAEMAQKAEFEARKHNLEVTRLRQQQALANSPAEQALLQAKIDKEQALAAKYLIDAQNAKSGGSTGKPDNYTRGMQVLASIPGIRPDQINALQAIVDSAAARSDYDKLFITTGNTYLMDELNKRGLMSDATRRYARQALAIILGAV